MTSPGDRPVLRGEQGVISLEYVLALPVLFVVLLVVLHGLVAARAVLVAHEAARAGARAAATSTGVSSAVTAAREAADGHDVTVVVDPVARIAGGLVTVTATVYDQAGPVPVSATARAVSRVEPGVGGP